MDLNNLNNLKNLSREEKNEILKAMGFMPFSFNTEEDKNDELVKQVYANGYVKNEKLHRRWITAQTLRLLGLYKSFWTPDRYYDNIRKNYNWHYSFKQIINECKAIIHLDETSPRHIFFSVEKIVQFAKDYLLELEKLTKKKLKVKNCKGIPYITIKGFNVFKEDIDKKILEPARKQLLHPLQDVERALKKKEINKETAYRKIILIIRMFMKKNYIKLPKDKVNLSKTWLNMFTAAGAYYSMKNLIKYSGLRLCDTKKGKTLNIDESLEYLEASKYEEGYKLIAMLKEAIARDVKILKAK